MQLSCYNSKVNYELAALCKEIVEGKKNERCNRLRAFLGRSCHWEGPREVDIEGIGASM